jgi:hypothetical protein
MIDKNDKLHTVAAYLANRSNSGLTHSLHSASARFADRANSDLTYSLLLRAVQVKIGKVEFLLQMLRKVDKNSKDYWLLDYRDIMKQKNFVSYVSNLKSDGSRYSSIGKTANDKFGYYMIVHKKLAKVKLSEISTEEAIDIIDEHIVLIRQANADAQIKEKIKLVDEL